MDKDLEFTRINPDKSIADFVESFWLLVNHTDHDKAIVILPDGRIDLFFAASATEPFHGTLSGLETKPDQAILAARTRMFAISFRLPAVEYIFQTSVAGLLDDAQYLPAGFWDFSAADLQDFDGLVQKATQQIQAVMPREIDARKRQLFDLIYSSNGALTVKELSAQVFWSSRQINRYFNQQFGLSLKSYCQILRFRAAFNQIKAGQLFPDQHFTDQSHFIKAVKKLSGVSPKELNKNQNDRFIQLSTLPPK